MENFLATILEHKKIEVETLKNNFKCSEEMLYKRETISLIKKLKQKENIGIIAEVKKGSPSKGLFEPNLNPTNQAVKYEEYGASAISVLTDNKFFYGAFEYLEQIRRVVNIPLLCKDFIIDEIQIQKARVCGADLILLIVAALKEDELKRLFKYAHKLGMEVLLEVHDKEELKRAFDLGAKLIGINNRNLKSFKVDLETTLKLAEYAKDKDILIISESGIKTKEDVEVLAKAMVSGFLIGETLVTSDNLEDSFKELEVQKVKC